jgi:hypothetical protein
LQKKTTFTPFVLAVFSFFP